MNFKAYLILACLAVACSANPAVRSEDDDSYMHRMDESKPHRIVGDEANPNYWINDAQATVLNRAGFTLNTNVAKNVIMFLGDGMSIPTLKAARVYMGQLQGVDGEGLSLSFEKFPYVGLSKTYCLNTQVPDSACTATAYLCGVKAIQGTLGVSGAVAKGDCEASLDESNHVDSIARWSQLKGKKTGIVTTTRVTHASPAGTYAHSAHRDWESDSNDVPPQCKDIADQLIHGVTGSNFDVIMGGGRREFLPNTVTDEEGTKGKRSDGRNLIDEWLESKENGQYIWNRTALLDLPEETQHLLGLFESNHCKYHLEANEETEPSLEEMTEAAIKLLSKGDNGYFLFVEGGRIDHAHHDTLAHKALDETVEFSKAIQRAREITSEDDTLIVVTSDHAHVMTVSGYPDRGANIFGIADKGSDGIPYATLSYANGPGYKPDVNGKRYDVSQDDMDAIDYEFPAMVPKSSETHGGDEVGVFASGPWAHIFGGVIQQNVIPHAMAYASCVGNGPTACNN